MNKIYLIFAILGWSWTILVLMGLAIWFLLPVLREKVRMRVISSTPDPQLNHAHPASPGVPAQEQEEQV